MNSLDTNYPVRYLEEHFWERLIKGNFWKEGSFGKIEVLKFPEENQNNYSENPGIPI